MQHSIFSHSSTSHGFFTHTHWLCSNVEEEHWYTSHFDDSSWSNAYVLWNDAMYSDGTLDSFDDRARLIWHHDLSTSTVFCRGRMFYGWYSFLIKWCNLFYLYFTFSFLYSDPIRMYSLAGASLEIPDGCYSYPVNDNLTNFDGSSTQQCMDECLVIHNFIEIKNAL